MKWFLVILVMVVLWVGIGAIRHERLTHNPPKNYILQVDNRHLGFNQDCVRKPFFSDNGWASVEIQVDPDRYFFEVEQANGNLEIVRRGTATLTASGKTDRIVIVYQKGKTTPYSIHTIRINPRG